MKNLFFICQNLLRYFSSRKKLIGKRKEKTGKLRLNQIPDFSFSLFLFP